MKIGMIGAGKVGFSLGKFFSQGGIQITGYFSRNPEDAKEAAAFTQSNYYDDLQTLVQDSDAIFITVPDKAITAVYRQLCQFEMKDKFICHCSGALSAQEAFPDLETVGAYGFSIHPLFPVSSKYEAYRELQDAFFCLEGDETYLPLFQSMLEGLGVQVQIIPRKEKVRYHAACAIASNLMCGLVQESIELLTACGFSPELARKALSPLMRSNMEHLIADGPMLALTGPVERGDETTVQKHLNVLETEPQRQLYRLLSRKLVDLASMKNPGGSYDGLREILQDERKDVQ